MLLLLPLLLPWLMMMLEIATKRFLKRPKKDEKNQFFSHKRCNKSDRRWADRRWSWLASKQAGRQHQHRLRNLYFSLFNGNMFKFIKSERFDSWQINFNLSFLLLLLMLQQHHLYTTRKQSYYLLDDVVFCDLCFVINLILSSALLSIQFQY